MRKSLSILELDRVVKFMHGLDKLNEQYGIGLSSVEPINLSIDGQLLPFELDEYEGKFGLGVWST